MHDKELAKPEVEKTEKNHAPSLLWKEELGTHQSCEGGLVERYESEPSWEYSEVKLLTFLSNNLV